MNMGMDNFVAKSVCGYFWQTVFGLFRMTFGVAVMGVVLYLTLTPVLQYVLPTELVEKQNINEIGSLFTYIDGGLLALIGFCLMYNKSSFLQVIGAYIKAVKTKVCPLIDFEDEDAA